MKLLKYFGIVLMFLITLMSVNAFNSSDNTAYYSLNSTLADATGNGHTLINSGVTYTTGKINDSGYWDGTDNAQSPAAATNSLTTGSVAFWVKLDDETTSYNLFGKNGAAFRAQWVTSADDFYFQVNGEGSLYTTLNLDWTQWHHIVLTWDGSNKYIYVDGAHNINGTAAVSTPSTGNLYLGHNSVNTNERLKGSLDEFAIFDITLNADEVAELYNGGEGFTYPYVVAVPTPQITLNITNGDIFNYTPINVSMDTTSNVNMSVYLNDVLNQTFTDTNSTSISLDFPEGVNNLSFKSEDENGINWNNISITNDYTAPNISIIGNLSQDFVTNFSQVFNVTDALSGLASCTINATYLENVTNASQYDKFVNCTDTTTFGAAGLYNGLVTATDNAGNIATLNVNGTIEVYVYLNFFDENATAISNYSAIIYHPDGEIETITNTSNPIELSPYHNDTLDIGTYWVTFSKLGYDLYNISVNINETSGGISYNYSVPGALIEIAVYDLTDYQIINGSNTTIEIIGDSFSEIYTTTTGYLNITSLLMQEETYSIVVSNPSYETTSTSFNFNNQEVIEVAAYMTPLELNDTLIADIIIRVVDDYQSPLRGLAVLQYVWDSGQSQYVQANLKATDYNGETSFKVFLNTKRYNFCAEYLGVQYCETDLFLNINTQEVVIEIPISELDVFDEDSIYDVDFSYTLTNTTIDIAGTNYTSVTFSYNNPNLDVDNYCLKVYQVENLQRTLVANQCSTSHTAGLSVNILENTSNTYVAVATIQVGDAIRELDSLYLYAAYEIQEELDRYGFVKLILLAVVGFLIGIALHKKVHNISLAHIALPVAFLIFSVIFPSYVSFESFVLVALVNWFAWSIISQKDDIKREKNFATLNRILAVYMIFIFGLFTALTEMDNKGILDDYGNVILTNIDDDNSYFSQFTDDTIQNVKDKRAGANTGAWELLTGIFLKTLEFVDMFFSILSNLFSIATNIGLIIGVQNALLLKLIKIIDYLIVAFVGYLYFKEAFK